MLRRGSMAQLLAAPVLGALAGAAALDVSEELVEVEADSVFGLLSLLLEAELSDEAFAPPPVLLYRSAYQPPPLRMKPAPPEICRLAWA